MKRASFVALALLVLALAVPPAAERVISSQLRSRVEARTGRHLGLGRVRLGWGILELYAVTLSGDRGPPPLVVPRVRIRFSLLAALGGHTSGTEIELLHPRVELVHGGPTDNMTSLRSRPSTRQAAVGESRQLFGALRIVDGTLAWQDSRRGFGKVARVDAQVGGDGAGSAVLIKMKAFLPAAARAGADHLTVKFSLSALRSGAMPSVEVSGGELTPFGGLELTDIRGSLGPDPSTSDRVLLDLRGSYGGAATELWNASGWFSRSSDAGALKLRADRFRLSQLDRALSAPARVTRILSSRDAEVDAHLDLAYAHRRLDFAGALHVAGLTLYHPMLGPLPIAGFGFDARLRGDLDLSARQLTLDEAAVDYRNVHALLTASIGNLGPTPKVKARFIIRPTSCQTALAAIPVELTPFLQGFKVTGGFTTDVHLGVDLGDLSQPVDLGGRVGMEGCKVLEAPQLTSVDRLTRTFEQLVEYESGHWLGFVVGPESPDFVPFDQLSPYLVNSILTTEDSGFFKHHGFISSEFRSALQQNLQRGYFRLGASSITMQMVKNVLLSREKTLSRKLQELFLTWYVEQHLSKERIMEIYFNVIEFGPGIYGIGRATRHYFGKSPRELQPQEAAWFSSILPNPKKRYVQYCHQAPDAKWQSYVKRIMRRMHERGRLTDEEYEVASATPLVFDRREALPEKECLALVHRLTTPTVELTAEARAAPPSGRPAPPVAINLDWGSLLAPPAPDPR